jgi:hypothetical protein
MLRQDSHIDFQTYDETPQALKKFQEGIVTRRDPTGGLANSHITWELVKDGIKGTNIKVIDPNE